MKTRYVVTKKNGTEFLKGVPGHKKKLAPIFWFFFLNGRVVIRNFRVSFPHKNVWHRIWTWHRFFFQIGHAEGGRQTPDWNWCHLTRFAPHFWLLKWFLRPQNVPRGPKCIFREVSSRLTNSRIFVKNCTFLGTACPHFVPSCLGKMAYFALWE